MNKDKTKQSQNKPEKKDEHKNDSKGTHLRKM